jgi:hypothetical protein
MTSAEVVTPAGDNRLVVIIRLCHAMASLPTQSLVPTGRPSPYLAFSASRCSDCGIPTVSGRI